MLFLIIQKFVQLLYSRALSCRVKKKKIAYTVPIDLEC